MRTIIALLTLVSICKASYGQQSWIRINQLGYTPTGSKVAVWCSKKDTAVKTWQLVNAVSNKVVRTGNAGKSFGAYGPFTSTYRLNFSSHKTPGIYYLQVGKLKSPSFRIDKDVYKGSADFCLRYMRKQRTGFNPSIKDSCHTGDGYSLYASAAGIKDSTYFDVVGGWHDASDYLQYSTTSANATYHLLAAYRDFPYVFEDKFVANGLAGNNQIPDVIDEATWGLKWLLKMFPSPNIMFNQIADDRDHISMRMPAQDTQYGRGNQRPVYYVSGEPQQRGKFMNNTTGTSSTAAKFSSAFALASSMNLDNNSVYLQKAKDALAFANKKKGVTQTASVRSPYIYAEENWVDDMELAYALNNKWDTAFFYAQQEPITPWLGGDTAKHYQWYPFINIGHYELLRSKAQLSKKYFDSVKYYYQKGIESVWQKAKHNAFYRGVPFIWCSNNLTTAFAQQCYWYRTQTGDKSYTELEQANIDWLFGCNPWGTSMVYGLPTVGDTPDDPHSAFTHIKKIPIDGGLVDGPVYGSIYKSLIGIKLYKPDEYEAFQSNLAVYHDDYGDYSTNEPTMDGTASLIYLLAAKENENTQPFERKLGAIIRGDKTAKKIALSFTAHEFNEGGETILSALKKTGTKASFFFTGDFYRNKNNKKLIQALRKAGHYLGPHSDKHLLYNSWENRNILLVSKDSFETDVKNNYRAMAAHSIRKPSASFFMPPFEWYNDSIAHWAAEQGLQLINFTPGTISAADYTWPQLKNYKSSAEIHKNILEKAKSKDGLNGFILLLHLGTDPRRTDKFYNRLEQLLTELKGNNYQFVTVNELLR